MSEDKPKGRPKKLRPQVTRSIRIDAELDKKLMAITDDTGIPYGRLINLVMRQFVESDTAMLSIMKGANDAR